MSAAYFLWSWAILAWLSYAFMPGNRLYEHPVWGFPWMIGNMVLAFILYPLPALQGWF